MKLFKISQNTNNNYDTFDSAIVAANSPKEAISIHPRGQIYPAWGKFDDSWVESPYFVLVSYIGESSKGFTEPCVILASFNAG